MKKWMKTFIKPYDVSRQKDTGEVPGNFVQ